ncbi:MAG: carbonic anhydrase [Candidatus Helarchaeota archaeon]
MNETDKITELLRRTRDFQLYEFSEFSHGNISKIPKLQTAIITCIDCRILIEKIFRLEIGEAVIIRTAGNIITSSVMRDLIVAIYSLSVNKIILIGHLDCGMKMTDADYKKLEMNIYVKTGLHINEFTKKLHKDLTFRAFLGGFRNPLENMRYQLKKLKLMKESSVIPENVIIEAFIYNEKKGLLEDFQFSS